LLPQSPGIEAVDDAESEAGKKLWLLLTPLRDVIVTGRRVVDRFRVVLAHGLVILTRKVAESGVTSA
jgi:hypothetical protein